MDFQDLDTSNIGFDELMDKINRFLGDATVAVNMKDKTACESALEQGEELITHIHDQETRTAKNKEAQMVRRELKEMMETQEE
jgi:hypothetical protein